MTIKKLEYTTAELHRVQAIDTTNKLVDRSLSRPVISRLFSGAGAPYAGSVTLTQVMLVPSEFNAIRIGYAHEGGSGALTAAKMVVAVTDDIGDLSLAATLEGTKYVVPYNNGSPVNTLDPNGWKAVSWSGNSTLSLADAGSQSWAVGYSDFIPLSSKPLLDKYNGRFDGYYAIIVRMYTGSASYTKGGYVGYNTSNYVNDVGPLLTISSAKAGDSVTTLTGWSAGDAVSGGPDKSLPIIVEAYRRDSSIKSIILCGDSRFASNSELIADRNYRTCGFYIEQQSLVSSQPRVNIISCAEGGRTVAQYQQRAVSYLNATGYADAAIYLSYSINDGTPTADIMKSCKQKALEFIDTCVKNKCIPVIVTSFPLGTTGYTGQQVEMLEDLEQFFLDLGVVTFSPLKEYGVASEGYRWKDGVAFDNSHMNDVGYQDLASKLLTLIYSVG